MTKTPTPKPLTGRALKLLRATCQHPKRLWAGEAVGHHWEVCTTCEAVLAV